MAGASVALRVLAEGRRDGLSDSELLARSPVVLALTGPRIAPETSLPTDAGAIRHLELDAVEALVTKRASAVAALIDQHVHHDGTPLPACFQLSDLGIPITARRADEIGGGTGAGGGTGTGPITHDVDDPPPGAVLVVTTLTPGLGPCFPGSEASSRRPVRAVAPGDPRP